MTIHDFPHRWDNPRPAVAPPLPDVRGLDLVAVLPSRDQQVADGLARLETSLASTREWIGQAQAARDADSWEVAWAANGGTL